MNIGQEIARIQQFIKEKVEESQTKGVVIGISGGIDSAVAACLSAKALGSERVLGLLMPSHTTPDTNTEDAMEVVRQLRIDHITIPIAEIILAFGKYLPEFLEGGRPKANLQARVRMCILYYFANLRNYLVCGTTDGSEYFLGYYTKYGDGGADIEPLIKLKKTEVRAIASELGLPDSIIKRKSSPDLMSGVDAESELGISYELLDRILDRNKIAEHKRNPPVSP